MRKDAALDAEATQRALFDKRLAQEEAWIRRGVEARRTKAQSRIRALFQMREERADGANSSVRRAFNYKTFSVRAALSSKPKTSTFPTKTSLLSEIFRR